MLQKPGSRANSEVSRRIFVETMRPHVDFLWVTNKLSATSVLFFTDFETMSRYFATIDTSYHLTQQHHFLRIPQKADHLAKKGGKHTQVYFFVCLKRTKCGTYKVNAVCDKHSVINLLNKIRASAGSSEVDHPHGEIAPALKKTIQRTCAYPCFWQKFTQRWHFS